HRRRMHGWPASLRVRRRAAGCVAARAGLGSHDLASRPAACERKGLMIGLVLVTHGQLATALIAAMEHIVGAQVQVRAVCIEADDDIERCGDEIVSAVRDVDTGSGVVVLTDMFGGTPSNLAISTMDRPGIEVVAGVNLPMLVKLASVRESETLAEAVASA